MADRNGADSSSFWARAGRLLTPAGVLALIILVYNIGSTIDAIHRQSTVNCQQARVIEVNLHREHRAPGLLHRYHFLFPTPIPCQ